MDIFKGERPANELQRMLRPFGLTITDEDAQRWIENKLVPQPFFRTWNPEIYRAELAACSYLTNRCGWTESDVRIGRHYMADTIEETADPIAKLDSFWPIEGKEEMYERAFYWLMTVLKFFLGWPPNGYLEATVCPAPGGGHPYAGSPSTRDILYNHEQKSFHPRPFEPPTGELAPE